MVDVKIDASTIVEALALHAAVRADKPFAIFEVSGRTQVMTFGELHDRAARIAGGLSRAGVRRGETVLVMHPTHPDLLAAFFGSMMIGAVPSIMPPLSTKQRPELYWSSHASLFDSIGPAAILTCGTIATSMGKTLPRFMDAILLIDALDDPFVPPVPPDRDEVAFLQHSSGTTSLKKGVMLSHRVVIDHLRLYADRLGFSAADSIASWLPLYHDMGLISSFLLPALMGATVVMMDPIEWSNRPRLLMEAITRHGCTFCWLPNFAFNHLVAGCPRPDSYDLSAVRAFINCSEPCKAPDMRRFVAHFRASALSPDAAQVSYGLAENVFAISQTTIGSPVRSLKLDRTAFETNRVEVATAGNTVEIVSCGRVLDGMAIVIVDADGRPCAPAEIGEILIRSPTLFSGYNNLPEVTARKLVDGTYHSGDLAFVHDGHLYVAGRKDDMIVAYGRNFIAHELEHTISQVEGVKPGRVVAFGVSAQSATTELAILFEPLAGTDVDQLCRRIRADIHALADITPRYVESRPIGSLIKTTSGKISRSLNRDHFNLARAGA